jgi:alpha-galactosidase
LLDPSQPKVLEYISEQISRIVGWGFKLIKYDFVSRDIFDGYGFQRPEFLNCNDMYFHDRTLTTAEIILNLYKTIREAAGDALLIGCNTIGHLCAGLVEINRTGDDTSGKEWERTRKMGINTLAFRMMQHKAFYASDADCVGLTASVPWELNSRWLNILSISGTPLFVSWDRSFTSDEIESAVRTALIRNSQSNDTLVPLDWMEKNTPEEWLLNGEKIIFKWQ